MRKKVVYVAIDETEFDDREECLQYEASLTQMSEFVQLCDLNGEPIEWNPGDYDSMWNRLYYIVIEPHREQEVEDWWANSFGAMIGVDPFSEIMGEWKAWKRRDHGDEPTVLAFDFDGNDSWIIFNEVYNDAKNVVRILDLVDALS